ncbi:urease accessory protein UreF [Alphaproteobacteria bacterium]|jgi:urease accessory protein|nr:urease accessory protein UreF [Alphaproteobacteria bacterium]MDA7545935.1 urease accessory protein UreF [Alphaproteobacteria bacterium]MDB2696916.1 urease accessory protein UreF [Alphaproteobacteria bacterium]
MGTNTKNTKNKFDYHQVLFSWFSPNFPIGSFNFSHGLEAAVEMKFIHDSFTLENWISNLITDGSGKTDVILLSNAYRGKNINELALALCPSKERWIESIKLGKSFSKNIRDNWSYNIEDDLAFPVALGKAGSFFSIPLDQLLIIFLQSFASNLITFGMKHIPLGQSAGQKILINLIPIIQAQSMKYKNYDIKDIGSSAFISDLASMYHENLKNRIYQT